MNRIDLGWFYAAPDQSFIEYQVIAVCELMGWVRNVVLIKCIFGSRKPRGRSGFWVGGYKDQVREQGSSLQAT
jgi:hypothetical protein